MGARKNKKTDCQGSGGVSQETPFWRAFLKYELRPRNRSSCSGVGKSPCFPGSPVPVGHTAQQPTWPAGPRGSWRLLFAGRAYPPYPLPLPFLCSLG